MSRDLGRDVDFTIREGCEGPPTHHNLGVFNSGKGVPGPSAHSLKALTSLFSKATIAFGVFLLHWYARWQCKGVFAEDPPALLEQETIPAHSTEGINDRYPQ